MTDAKYKLTFYMKSPQLPFKIISSKIQFKYVQLLQQKIATKKGNNLSIVSFGGTSQA